MATISITVIIPVYNAAAYLRQCLDSITGQTLRNVEIIAIDDGSTDNSIAIIGEAAKSDDRIVFLSQEHGGAGKARNLGMQRASGEYIAFMDADDYYPGNDTLEHMYQAAVENGALICGGGQMTDLDGRIVPGTAEQKTAYSQTGYMEYRDVQRPYGYWRYIYQSAFLRDNRISFPDYLRYQDPPFFVRAMVAAERFYALAEDTYCYRRGYKKIDWTFPKINDLVRGVTDNLIIAQEHHLEILQEACIAAVENNNFKHIVQSLQDGNYELLKLLCTYNDLVRQDLSRDAHIARPLAALLQARKQYKAELTAVTSSLSYRVGRFITYIPRKIFDCIRRRVVYGRK